MDFISGSLGTALDEIYQRLGDCNFGLEDPKLVMFTAALLIAMRREGRGERYTELILMMASPVPPKEVEIGSSDSEVEKCLVTTWLVSQD